MCSSTIMCWCIYIHVEEEADDKKLQEKQKRKVLQSSIVQELKNEYLDLPEDVHVSNYNYILVTTVIIILSAYYRIWDLDCEVVKKWKKNKKGKRKWNNTVCE